MGKPTEQDIAARAYRLWEAAGMPEGKDEEFWRAAEQELLNEDKSNPTRTPDTLRTDARWGSCDLRSNFSGQGQSQAVCARPVASRSKLDSPRGQS